MPGIDHTCGRLGCVNLPVEAFGICWRCKAWDAAYTLPGLSGQDGGLRFRTREARTISQAVQDRPEVRAAFVAGDWDLVIDLAWDDAPERPLLAAEFEALYGRRLP
jgi:hypothetical protein